MSGLSARDEATVDSLYRLYGPPRLRNCPVIPTPKQEAFLLLHGLEGFFGGAAGGGKSVALLIATGVKQTGVYFLTPTELLQRTDKDPTTRRLMEEILATEEEHADDLSSLVQELGS